MKSPGYISVPASASPDRGQDLCESRRGRPELPVPNGPYGLRGRKAAFEEEEEEEEEASPTMNLNQSPSELKNCVKETVDVLVSPSLIVRTVSVDVKHHLKKKKKPLQ